MNYKHVGKCFFLAFVSVIFVVMYEDKIAIPKMFDLLPRLNSVNVIESRPGRLLRNSSCSGQPFKDYQSFRQTIFDAFVVLDDARLSDNYKAGYMNMVAEFLTQLKGKKMFAEIGALLDLDLGQKLPKMPIKDSRDIFGLLGYIFRAIKAKFEAHFASCINKCYQDLESAKKQIIADLRDIQTGAKCRESKKYLHVRQDLAGVGMGSALHRLAQCLTMGLRIGTPCFANDTYFFVYGSGELRKILKNLQLCPEAKNASRLEFFSAGSEMTRPDRGKFSLPAVPRKYVSTFHYCHEDISAWYAGVLIVFLMEPTESLTQDYKMFESKYLNKLGPDYFGLHIRSTDKSAIATKLVRNAREFGDLLLNWETFAKTTLKNIYVASDNSTYFQELTTMLPSKTMVSLNQTTDPKTNRFNPKELRNFCFDIIAVQKSNDVIGTYSSNFLRLWYELRSVNDLFPSSKLFSLDSFYYYNPSLFHGINYKTNNDAFCFKSRTPLESQTSTNPETNKCFPSTGQNSELVNNRTLNVVQHFKTPTSGFHRVWVSYQEPNSSKQIKTDCYAPMFALEKIQVFY